MSVTRGWLGAALLVLTGTSASAQSPWTPTNALPASPQPSLVVADQVPMPGQVASSLPHEIPPPAPPGSGGPSGPAAHGTLLPPRPSTTQGWLDYEYPACCGPFGRHGPIGYDVYFRSGLSVPIGDSPLSRGLNVGYLFFLGGRTLLFNPPGDAAWVMDLAIFYGINNGNGSEPIRFIGNSTATVRTLHRSGVSLGLGRDWYSSAPGFVMGSTACTRAYGVDFGVRYGSTHVDLNLDDPVVDYARLQDIFGQSFLGLHTDWEFPRDGWTLLLGARFEWTYMFTDVLQATNSELHDLNFLVTIGVRY